MAPWHSKLLRRNNVISKFLFGFLILYFFTLPPVPAQAASPKGVLYKVNASLIDFYNTYFLSPLSEAWMKILNISDNNPVPSAPLSPAPKNTTSPTPLAKVHNGIVEKNEKSIPQNTNTQNTNIVYNKATTPARSPITYIYNTYPTTIIRETVSGENNSGSSFVSKTLFNNQINGILSSIEDSSQGLSDSLREQIHTNLLAVSGNATITGDLTITGTCTGCGGGASAFTSLTDVPASYAGQGTKVVRVNAGETGLEFFTLPGGGDALTGNPLSQFAATTSLQLKGVISDETGSGALVFANSPVFVTPNIGNATGNISGNAATVTINANLTGPITSVGNATSVGAQTGTGTTFVMQNSPTLITPVLGTATYTSLSGTSLTASALTGGRVTFAGTGGLLSDDADLTFSTDTLTATKLLAPTSVSTPSLISTGALTITPAAGSNLNVNLSTTGDFAVNTNQLYVDTSTGNVGIGTGVPGGTLDILSSLAAAFTVGRNGATNPAFQVDPSAVGATTGLKITGNTAGSGVSLSAISSGTNEDIFLNTKGTGRIILTPGSATSVLVIRNASSQIVGTFGDPGTGTGAQFTLNTAGSGEAVRFTTTAGLQLINSLGLFFNPNNAFVGNPNDTGLSRNGAGILEINHGNTGQWGAVKLGTNDSGTNTITNGLTLGHQSTGTPGAGLGTAILFNLNSNTTADQNAARIAALWTDATHATRTSALAFSTVNSGSALTEALRILGDGSVGIGTTLPDSKLDVRGNVQVGTSGAAQSLYVYQDSSSDGLTLFDISDNDNAVVQLTQQSDGGKITLSGGSGAEFRSNGPSYFDGGNVGIGTPSPGTTLDVDGTVTLRNNGASGVGDVFLCITTGGIITQGATCAASSEKVKDNVSTFTDGLADIMKLSPVTFNYKPEYYGGKDDIGFIAEHVAAVDPRFAIYAKEDRILADGQVIHTGDPMALNISAILSATVASVQELNLKLESIASPLPEPDSFSEKFFENLYVKTAAWLGDAGNSIGDFFANRIHTKEICVSDDSGETCITRGQLDALIANTGNSKAEPAPSPNPKSNPTPGPESESISTTEPTPEQEVTSNPEQTPEPATPLEPTTEANPETNS